MEIQRLSKGAEGASREVEGFTGSPVGDRGSGRGDRKGAIPSLWEPFIEQSHFEGVMHPTLGWGALS